MLALVVLEPLRETKSRIAEAHIGAMVATSGDAVESEDRENLERRIVDRACSPGVARELSAGSVVRLGAKDPDARRVDASILGDYVADHIIRKRGDDLVAGGGRR
jgi:hypothetical protein